ncbi:zinc-binding dehydrogenase family protein [Anaplasma phagocytophilum str. ApNP]|nr:zinc-binding dehydrogenase family protein [Anaplasma phagocytophilum str. ApNP]
MSTLGTRSWFVAAPQLQHYKRSRLELALTAMEVFEVVRRGHIKVDVGRVYSFQDIEKAHSDLENRKLSGHCIIRMK